MKKKYELISLYSGIVGMAVMLIGCFSFVYFAKMTAESMDSWWWKPFVFIGVSFLFVIPMAIYGKKALEMEVQEVQIKDSKELESWIKETSKKNGKEYVNKVMRKAGYSQKWVKNA